MDPENKLSKYAPKNWRNSHTHVSDYLFIAYRFIIIRKKMHEERMEGDNK